MREDRKFKASDVSGPSIWSLFYAIEPTGHTTQQSIVIAIIERGWMQTSPTDFCRTFSQNNRFRKSYGD